MLSGFNQENTMTKVNTPQEMNQAFANAFNTRDINILIQLYEKTALLRIDSDKTFDGIAEISEELQNLLEIPGTMYSKNNFYIIHGNIALLRADYSLVDNDSTILSGSSAEVVRQQADGSWRYIIDHALGATLPRVDIIS